MREAVSSGASGSVLLTRDCACGASPVAIPHIAIKCMGLPQTFREVRVSTPEKERKVKAAGCALLGHVYVYSVTEDRPMADSEQWSAATYRHYVCSNCGHRRETFMGYVPRDEYESEEE